MEAPTFSGHQGHPEILLIAEQKYRFAPDADKAFKDYLERRMDQPRFANGRSVRNALDRLRMRHAIRLWEGAVSDDGTREVTKGDLVTIQAEDVMKSPRVRGGGQPRPRGDPLMADKLERVVLARRTTGFQPFQWTGDEPDALNDEDDYLNDND